MQKSKIINNSLSQNNLQIFQKDNAEIKIVKDENGEPLFCLSDICKALEHSNSRAIAEAIRVEFQGDNLKLHPFQTQGGIQNFTMITEPQLYFMLMRSDKPKAKEFRQWVINEVLPSIRKNGGYAVNQKINTLQDEIYQLKNELLKIKDNLTDTQKEPIKKENPLKKQTHSNTKKRHTSKVDLELDLEVDAKTISARRAIGARLASVRKAEGLKQKQMCKILKIEPRNYGLIENDGKAPLRPAMMVILFREFKVDLQWLITGEAMPNSKEVLNTMRISE